MDINNNTNSYELLNNMKSIIEKSMNDFIIKKGDIYNQHDWQNHNNNISELEEILEKNKILLKNIDNSSFNYGSRNYTFSNSISEIYNNVDNIGNYIKNESFWNIQFYLQIILKNIKDIIKTANGIKYLDKILDKKEQVTVIVGANGSGKSSFAEYLRTSIIPTIKVIPASKFLYIYDDYNNLHRADRNSLNNLQLINQAKIIEDQHNHTNENIAYFTTAIGAFSNQFSNYATDIYQGYNKPNDQMPSIISQLKSIWNDLFPDTDININGGTRTINGVRNGEHYYINRMSDGERAVLYYACNVLLAQEDSKIIIDEPETFINDNIAVKLWNLLCEIRKDCKFIFLTHNLEFVSNIGVYNIIWCKNYTYPDKWDFEELPSNELPTEMIVKIACSKKPILYCEGDLDKQVYEKLFGSHFTIVSVGGCNAVIDHVKTHKNSRSLKGIQDCVGIIDFDNNERDQEFLNEYNIYILHHNEIEMLLMDKIIIDFTMKVLNSEKYEDNINKYIDEFFELIENEKDLIITNTLANKIHNFLEKEKLQKCKNINEISESFVNIINSLFQTEKDGIISLEEIQAQIESEKSKLEENIDKILEKKDYKAALQVCNLKCRVYGDKSRILHNDYVNIAKWQLAKPDLKEKILDEYFKDIKDTFMN